MNDGPIALVTSARSRVRRALEQWNPADRNAMQASQDQLEQAVYDMQQLKHELQGGDTSDTDLRSSLLNLRSEIDEATRTLDAGAAFYGRLAVRLGRTMPGYDAAGRVPPIENPGVACELQG
jgi:hypothetical protein